MFGHTQKGVLLSVREGPKRYGSYLNYSSFRKKIGKISKMHFPCSFLTMKYNYFQESYLCHCGTRRIHSTNANTGNDRYSGKNGQGFLFHYSGRLLYGTQHISSPSPIAVIERLKLRHIEHSFLSAAHIWLISNSI